MSVRTEIRMAFAHRHPGRDLAETIRLVKRGLSARQLGQGQVDRTRGKNGPPVPVGVGPPTILPFSLTVGGAAT